MNIKILEAGLAGTNTILLAKSHSSTDSQGLLLQILVPQTSSNWLSEVLQQLQTTLFVQLVIRSRSRLLTHRRTKNTQKYHSDLKTHPIIVQFESFVCF
jgi:hypothetical protein